MQSGTFRFFFRLVGFLVIFEALFCNVSYIGMPWNLIEAHLMQHSTFTSEIF